VLDPEDLGQRRNDLAGLLRELRKQAGLTGDRLAARCGISQSKVSRIETGRIVPSVLDVERMLTALDAPPQLVDGVISLARLANTEFQDIRAALRKGLHKKQNELAGLEASATELRYFLPVLITGLLNTPEYARASLEHASGDIAQTVARKLERQAVLYDTDKWFTFVVTEAAVRWSICPPTVMATQIDRLVSVSKLPNVQMCVIPLGQYVPRGPLNTFTVYDSRLVTAETFGGAIIMRDPRDVEHHLQLFTLFEQHSRHSGDATDLLVTWADDFRR